MFIGTISCSGKCCTEAGIPLSVCQNDEWRKTPNIYINDYELCRRYTDNPLTSAVVIGGLEPFEQFGEVLSLIICLRNKCHCNDDIVIYTGYEPNEIHSYLEILKGIPNIIVKFGRFIPNRDSRFDEVLGIKLASDNQYAERISVV